MSLPSSRNTTYGPHSPVKSEDLNDLQDCAIGGKRAEFRLHALPWAGKAIDGTWVESLVTGLGNRVYTTGASGQWKWRWPLALYDFDRIRSVKFWIGRTSGTVTGRIIQHIYGTGNAASGLWVATSSGGNQQLVLASLDIVVNQAGYSLEIEADEADASIYGCEVFIDRP